ncbi:MAG: putative oxidoreductase, partial [Thalassolituus oleivorans]
MQYLPVLGRVLFALPFIMFGFGHLTGAADMAGMVPSFLPMPVIIVYATGLLLVVGGLALAAGFRTKQAALALAVFVLLTAVLVHLPNAGADMGSFSNLMKDLGLGGALLMISHFGAG